MIVVTAATGQLGRRVVQELLQTADAREIVAAVRTPAKASALQGLGVEVRAADYAQPATLHSAFRGATRLLLISGTEQGARVEQHRAVIDAAKEAGVSFLAYTSILHCDTSALLLAKDHAATERYLQGSGLPYALLRNGWYFENQTAGIGQALKNGAVLGAAGDGRFASAPRADYAIAAAKVLTASSTKNQILELAGDARYTYAEFAAELSRQTGREIPYRNLPEAEYQKMLAAFLPETLATAIADADAGAAKGALDDDSHTLSQLLGRPTATLAEAVAAALQAPPATH